MSHPPTLDAILRQRSALLIWYLRLDLLDPNTGQVETLYLATVETTVRPTDSQAPGRRHPGRLLPPTLSWSLVRGDQVEGASEADRARFEWLDLAGVEGDITTRQLTAAGQTATLWLGHPELDSSLWRPFHFAGARLLPTASGWALELRTLDHLLDQALPRRALLGMGGCLSLDGAHHLTIDPHIALAPAAYMAVEAMFRTTHTGEQVLAAKGNVNAGDWSVWIATDGKLRWWMRDASSTLYVCKGGPVVTDGQIHRATGHWDGSTMTLMVDGEITDTQVMDQAPQDSPAIGITLGDDGSGSRRLVGDLDDVRIWQPPYLLGPIPTLDDYSSWAMRELPDDRLRWPRVYLRFGEGAGSVAYDDSLHQHTATIQGPDPEARWSSLYEGSRDQRDQLRPLGIGTRDRVPGRTVGARRWQVSDVGVHGLGPVDEGGNKLRPHRSWTSSGITIETGTDGLSPSLPVDWIRTDNLIDVGGLIRNQHLLVTTPTQVHRVRLMGDSTPTEISVEGGVLSDEGPGVVITLETEGYQATASDITIDPAAGTLTTAGALQFIGQLAGDTFNLTGGAAAGDYTLAEDAKAQVLTVRETFPAAVGPGVTMTITFDDPGEYTVDLAKGSAQLKAENTLPLAFAYRGLLAAGSTRSSLMRWLAEHGGQDPASIDTAAWDAFAAADPGPVGLWLDHDDEPTTREAMDRLSHGASWGTNLLTGKLDVALRSLEGAPALELVYPEDFLELSPWNTPEPIGGQTVEYARNLVPLDDEQVAGRVRDTNPSAVPGLQAEHQIAEATINETHAAANPLAKVPDPLPSHYTTEEGAKRGAQHLYDLDAPARGVWRAVLPLGVLLLLDWRRQLVRITSPHHKGLEAGRKLLTLSLNVDDAKHAVEVYFWG